MIFPIILLLSISSHSGGHGGNGKAKTSLISTLHNPNFYTSQLQTPIHDGDKYLTEYTQQGQYFRQQILLRVCPRLHGRLF